MKAWRYSLLFFLLILLISSFSCLPQTPRHPVTLNVWHNYFGGGPMQNKMDELIDEFNRTEGREQGIIVNVTLIGTSSDLLNNIDACLKQTPGAPELPHITIAYPRTAAELLEHSLIVNLSPYFTAEELAEFKPEFLEEGRLDGSLYVLPANKSTEVLFLNRSFFERTAASIGAKLEQLTDTEALFATAKRYYAWTDAQTPETSGDGQCFLAIDSWYNFFQIYLRQNGAELLDANGALNWDSPHFLKLWGLVSDAALDGSLSLYPGYASEISRIGETVCSIGSTAGVLYYGQEVTSEDGRTEKVDYQILPFPVAPGQTALAIQRGGGLIVTRSDEAREKAAVRFLKWFTQVQRNYDFTLNSGYMPVKSAAYSNFMAEGADASDTPMMRSLQLSLAKMAQSYRFSYESAGPRPHGLNERFDKLMKGTLETYKANTAHLDKQSDARAKLKAEILARIRSELERKQP